MSKVFIDIENEGTYILSDVVCTSGGFEVIGTFNDWQEVNGQYFANSINLGLVNVRRDNLLHISKANYCIQKKRFEIHVETVYDARNINHKLNYKKAGVEEFKFPEGIETEVIVVILIYNSDIAVKEVVYEVCGTLARECLKFPRPKDACNNLASLKRNEGKIINEIEIDCDSPGFDPKRKKGNILVGG
ncbi:hypothetical protein [uncultured Kordia sp.]|uniref:hypothetical protein n=1 Tax=uncultured Kordia sp. TaxID=507699 RepID=UPI00261C985F|nr:hypothetical protein [uncultured Kordia sp.]